MIASGIKSLIETQNNSDKIILLAELAKSINEEKIPDDFFKDFSQAERKEIIGGFLMCFFDRKV